MGLQRDRFVRQAGAISFDDAYQGLCLWNASVHAKLGEPPHGRVASG
jgi:hypothetical protein